MMEADARHHAALVKKPMEWNSLVPELTVTDFARSRYFYETVLGFTVHFTRSNPDFAYLSFEGSQLMLEAYHQTGWNVAPLEYPFGRGVNFSLTCADATSLRDRVVASGVALYRDLRETWYDADGTQYGQREFLVQDPDGYLLRFTEDL
jgi:catechol 2,3-dioxygenase-like lactoylglutathione lyase family enzyme